MAAHRLPKRFHAIYREEISQTLVEVLIWTPNCVIWSGSWPGNKN